MAVVRPPLLDVALGGGLALLGVAQVVFEGGSRVEVFVALGMTLPVILRSVAPLLAVSAGWFILFAEGGLGTDVTSQGYAAILALWITIYSVARHGRSTSPAAGLVWAMACVWGSVLVATGVDLPSLTLTTIVTLAPWLAGYAVRRAERGRVLAEDEAVQAVTQAESRVRAAVAEERTRIAREVHDVLGHSLGLMVLQLGAADHAMDADPARAREALRAARGAGKSALAEVRYLIGLEASGGSPSDPVRRLVDIPDLIQQVRAAGVEVQVDLGADLSLPVPSTTGLAAYRIVQESLTNAVRHGRSPVCVTFGTDATVLVITIRNPLRLPAGRMASQPGRGIIGMTERARSCGGSLTAREASGEFVVEARLPVVPNE